ncbi:hypothetical protein N9H95_04780 [Gammaproteobacteria bacterium]|nr:hypothetical protein [Gammaproteobacteria bacterium]MDA7786700.1 hypothetical protein [Gammaproteobacteria bacterium]MDA7802378.1 hypothetical protein [Gammaproteobacteria bacterium]MDA8856557.1 hypothetical protein [Gammaproteobacteria bacterium]MDA9045190.1 hypothetical protein [Gammaproteobacteria bacterium]
MQILVITLVILFLFGSISLAVPSKKSRAISKLRLDAMKKGFKITSLKISNFNFKSKDFLLMVYQFRNKVNLKDAHFIRDKDDLILYSPLKLKYSDGYDGIRNELFKLPVEVSEIIFSPTHILFLWNEKGGMEVLEEVSNVIEKLEY